ncbi:MAG: DUF1501 domain-containing protein [Anaerolineae bacterium]
MKSVNFHRLVSRRETLSMLGGVSVLGVSKALFPTWMPRLAFRQNGAPGDVLISIFLRGGMDGLNAVVPFGEGARYYDSRPTIAIAEPNTPNGAINLDGFFGLHPKLAPLKDIYDAGALAIVHAAGSPDPTRSHFDAMTYMERGIPGNKSVTSGWIARHLETAAWQNDSPFRAVGMGAMVPASLNGAVTSLALQSIADFHLGGREDQIEAVRRTLASLYAVTPESDFGRQLLAAQASNTFNVIDLLAQIGSSAYTPSGGAVYPETEFGLGMRQIAQLIKAGVGLEVACVDLGGWDTHENQGGAEGEQANVLAELAAGIAALYTDLGELMGSVTLVAMSEFGRRVQENASSGTDHGHGNAMFVLGGGINGGKVYADWRGLAPEALDEGDVAITTDYRDVLGELLTSRILNPALDQIFPNHTSNFRGIAKPRG